MTKMTRMKVRIGELKTHLSSYLRKIEESGEPVEVCVRERTVAYLTPVREKCESGDDTLIARLQRAGIEWDGKGGISGNSLTFQPEVAGDGKTDQVSTDNIRKGRDW